MQELKYSNIKVIDKTYMLTKGANEVPYTATIPPPVLILVHPCTDLCKEEIFAKICELAPYRNVFLQIGNDVCLVLYVSLASKYSTKYIFNICTLYISPYIF